MSCSDSASSPSQNSALAVTTSGGSFFSVATCAAVSAAFAACPVIRYRPWSMLEGLYRMTGQAANAAETAAHVATLKKLPPEVVTAKAPVWEGELAESEQLIRAFLIKHGHHVEAMRLLARIGIAREVLDDAQLLLEAVLELAPDYHAARLDYTQVLIDRHLYRQAQEQAERLLTWDRANRRY